MVYCIKLCFVLMGFFICEKAPSGTDGGYPKSTECFCTISALLKNENVTQIRHE